VDHPGKTDHSFKMFSASDEHSDETQISLVVNSENISDLFDKRHIDALSILNRAAEDVDETARKVQRSSYGY